MKGGSSNSPVVRTMLPSHRIFSLVTVIDGLVIGFIIGDVSRWEFAE